MLASEHPWRATRFEAGFVSRQNRRARIALVNLQLRAVDGEMCTGREADQIDGPRHAAGFVEIVDAPDQPALGVAPRSEIFYVQIAHREK